MRRSLPYPRIAMPLLGLIIILTTSMLRADVDTAQLWMDPFLVRIVLGQSAGFELSGVPAPIHPEEIEHLARFLAIDAQADPPTARVRLRLDEAARAAIEALGIKTYGAMSGFASAVVPLPRLQEVADLDGVGMMQIIRIPQLELDVSVPEIRADEAAASFGARGQGVLVGLIDTGVDWQHDDFRRPDGSTRIRFIWSQDSNCVGPSPEPPFDFGCLYTEADINAALEGAGSITAPDANGHGTHVLGIAAGDGSAMGTGTSTVTFISPAPESDLIVVKVFPEPGSPCATCFEIGLGLDFIDHKAAELGMPYVVNLSLGSDFGGHDGSDLDELTIDALTGPGIPGKVIVKSAGNNRGRGIHASGVVAPGMTNTHNLAIPSYTPLPGVFNDVQAWSMWYEGGDSMTVTIVDPAFGCPGDISLSSTTGSGFSGIATDSGAIIIDDTGSPAPNGARFFHMEIDDQIGTAPCPGIWTMEVTGNEITAGGRYDMWIWFSSFGALGNFSDWTEPDLSRLITVPGTAVNVTTVGAYKTKQEWTNIDGNRFQLTDTGAIGGLASFSSPGPTRDGRLKPEIAAPGMGIVAPLSIDVRASVVGPGGTSRALVQQDGVHWILLGTSMSAAHVTGVYAQMLGLDPTLDAIELRSLLMDTARTDVFTDVVPNEDWGHGKLDALGVIETLACLEDGTPPTLTCPMDVTAECQFDGQAEVNLPSASATDPCDGTDMIENDRTPNGPDASGTYTLGTTIVTYTATDRAGNSATCTTAVIVVDTMPPTLSVTLVPSILWPPNHRMIDVEASATAADECSAATMVLTSISSNEADNGLADGNTINDIQDAELGTADFQFQFRAERAGTGQGRTYTVTYGATDTSGNEATAVAFAFVPHDLDGVTEPLILTAHHDDAGTILRWSEVLGALHYNVVRGEIDNVREKLNRYDLGQLACVASGMTLADTAGFEDVEIPALGEAFFYLAEYYDGVSSGFGTESAAKERNAAPGQVNCF